MLLRLTALKRTFRQTRIFNMPTTRSASRGTVSTVAPEAPAPVAAKPRSTKRKASETVVDTEAKSPKKRATKTTKAKVDSAPAPSAVGFEIPPVGDAPELELLPAKLTFSFEEAKTHLIESDSRFAEVFTRQMCKPFEKLDRVEPFKTLTSSILGQQISWIAARSVRHKFIRLYYPELPEKPDEEYWAAAPDADKFPTPHQVALTPIAVLRTAGLSARKAEYVTDLASRFDDGRLSGHKLFEAEDEDLYEMLTAVRGIGRWTVDMFAIFSLRRPNIMPSGDLGVQRGVLRWFLSLHNPSYRIEVSPQKSLEEADSKESTQPVDDDALPAFGPPGSTEGPATPPPRTATLPEASQDGATQPDETSSQMRPPVAPTPSALGLPSLPTFTPSINNALERRGADANDLPAPLPAGLTATEMKARLTGKKKVKGALLTPAEMEALTESWKPYRSLAVYFMWGLAENAKEPK
ncbi:DNA glycosylase [Peniophora sp. CONT]|nr:DNA glycosylase [Peniophora sp. CONT]